MLAIVFKTTIHLDTMPRYLGGLYQARATTHDLRGTNKLTVPCIKTTTDGFSKCEKFRLNKYNDTSNR